MGERPRILVVDDEQVIRDMLADFLAMEGYAVETAEDGVAAVERLEAHPFDLVLSDLKMPRMGGIALLDEIARAAPHAVTVIMTGFGTVETAIDAMKRGAYDYVLKPFKLDEVVHVVRRGLDKQRMTTENLRLREALSLYKVSEAIQASLSLDQVLETVVDSCRDELHADAVRRWSRMAWGARVPVPMASGSEEPRRCCRSNRPPSPSSSHVHTASACSSSRQLSTTVSRTWSSERLAWMASLTL